MSVIKVTDSVCALPHPLTHLCFWSDVQEVESEDVCWDATLLGIVTKHTDTATLGKLAIFIVEVLYKDSVTLHVCCLHGLDTLPHRHMHMLT